MIETKFIKKIVFFKKYCRQLKMSVFKTNCSTRFHSIGLDNLREGYPIFRAVSLFLMCGKRYVFPTVVGNSAFFSHRSTRLFYISFGLWSL
jgi:hypothetical protein